MSCEKELFMGENVKITWKKINRVQTLQQERNRIKRSRENGGKKQMNHVYKHLKKKKITSNCVKTHVKNCQAKTNVLCKKIKKKSDT